ncbi:heterokaryon incompatibility protein-domain-containing protein [Corynascus similis CBS 632.67]
MSAKSPTVVSRISSVCSLRQYRYPYRLADIYTTVVRLIELLPGSGDEPLVCHLREVDLEDNPEYETISHCWGEPMFDAELHVQNEGSLAITALLASALRHLRFPNRSRTLWADVICVNQQDTEERTVQVQLMNRIYRQCRGVLIWLGNSTPESDLGMEVARKMHAGLVRKQEAGDKRLLYDMSRSERAAYGLFPEGSREIRAMTSLVDRPWFSRTWIVQELALPPTATLVCGSQAVPWDHFALAVTSCSPSFKKFSTNEHPGENHVRLSICPSRDEATHGKPPPLLRLIARARNSLATDPRDKIFAFSGLAKERGEPSVLGRPDYRLSVAEVYRAFVLENISTYKTLDVFSLAHGRDEASLADTPTRLADLPSWVPDLSVRGIPYPLTRLDKVLAERHATLRTKSDYLEYCAAGDSETTTYALRDEETTLCLSGYVVDAVGPEVGLPFPGRSEWGNVWRKRQAQHNAWASWEALVGARRNAAKYGDESAYDVYWKVMRGGELERHCAVAKQDFVTGYELPRRPYRVLSRGKVVRSPTLFKLLYTLSCRVLDARNVLRRASGKPVIEYTRGIGTNPCEYRAMGKSAHGRVCFLPGAAKEGDAIALLEGGRVPFVLRSAGEGKWRLIGEAYVHGIMEGEAWDADKCNEICLV